MLLCLFGSFFNGLLCSGVVLAWWCRGGGVIVVVAVGYFKEEGEREIERNSKEKKRIFK